MKRVLIFMFILLGLVSGVSALDSNKFTAYYAQDNNPGNLLDSTTNGNDASTTDSFDFIEGKIKQAAAFTGTKHINTSLNPNGWSSFSVAVWVNISSVGQNTGSGIIWARGGTASGLALNGLTKIRFDVNSGGTIAPTTTYNDDLYHFVVGTYSGSTTKLYVDGSLVGSGSTSGNVNSDDIFKIGYDDVSTARKIVGNVDEVSIFQNYVLTATDVTTLYNSSFGSNPFAVSDIAPSLSFDNIKANNVTLVNNTFYNDTIQFETFVLNTSTNANVNHSYSLNGAAFVQYATNNLNGSVTLNQTEGSYNISFQATNNETQVNSSNYSYTIDKTNPVITDTLNGTEINSYVVNLTNVSCSDTNLDYCNITIQGNEYNLLNTTTITLLYNGNVSYNVSSGDLAGNTIASTGQILINPNQCNNFFVANLLTPITDYTFNNDTFASNPACYKTYNDGLILGNNTFLFSKSGYELKNISFVVNTTNELNLSHNITASKIIINIYDRETEQLLNGLTEIDLIADVGYNATTTNGTVTISDIVFGAGDYQIISVHEGYATEYKSFTYTAQEILNIDVFMLNKTTPDYGTITLRAISNTGELLKGALCSALEWKSNQSAFISVASGLTNINGDTILNIEIDTKYYKFTCTKEGVTSISSSQIIQESGTTLPLILDVSVLVPSPSLENLVYSLINTTENATHERITFTWADTDGLVTQGCVNMYKVKGLSKTQLSTTCASGSTSQIQILIDVNQTYNTVAYGIVTVNGLDRNLDSIIFPGSQSIEASLKQNNLALIIPFLFALLGLVIGFAIKPQNIYMSIVGMFIGLWFGVSIVTDIIPKGTTYFISVMLILMLWGAYKFK